MKELKNRSIPYKIYLSEDEMPRYWYNGASWQAEASGCTMLTITW